jgi:hypothetical protein
MLGLNGTPSTDCVKVSLIFKFSGRSCFAFLQKLKGVFRSISLLPFIIFSFRRFEVSSWKSLQKKKEKDSGLCRYVIDPIK